MPLPTLLNNKMLYRLTGLPMRDKSVSDNPVDPSRQMASVPRMLVAFPRTGIAIAIPIIRWPK